MKDKKYPSSIKRAVALLSALAVIAFATTAMAAPPVVKTVRAVSSLPALPHDTYSGKTITLKGTCDQQGANLLWTWDFGDGSPVVTGSVTDKYVIQATHAYTGPEGLTYTARLTVRNTATSEVGSSTYAVIMRAKSLPVEQHIAKDEGLWYLHKSQSRYNSGGVDYGDWRQSLYGGYAYHNFVSISALNINAFEANGFLESGDPNDPYTETVQRGMRSIFTWLTVISISIQVNPLCTLNPDSNGNGLGIFAISQYGYQPYQSGMLMDAIIASDTPGAVATTGPANVVGRTYRDIVQDMVDAYAWAQYDYSPQGGGWRYDPNTAPDNSACQWAAIGIIAAERSWGCIVPQCVKDWNITWLKYSQSTSTGVFGYTDSTPIWGPYGTTPSGLVQLAMDGICRGMVLPGESISRWNLTETYLCDNFRTSASGPTVNIKDYYYGLFSFMKAMLYHNCNGTNAEITLLQSQTPGVQPLDWYWDPTYGVVRTLVDDQSSGGYWWGHDYYADQYPMETGIAVIMLAKGIVPLPEAVIRATPNPALTNSIVVCDGSGSYHNSTTNVIVQWEWDLNDDRIYETPGPIVSTSWPTSGTNRIWLRVTDDIGQQAVTSTDVIVMPPPVPPTADAGANYVFCPEQKPWYLDGSRSVNPDEGISFCGGSVGDTIIEYAWDLDASLQFTNAFGIQVDVTAFFEALGPGSYVVQLRVKDRTSLSYPCYGTNDLLDFASATVTVKDHCDLLNCSILTGTNVPGTDTAVLMWTPYDGASAYNIYRGTTFGGPYAFLGTVVAPVTSYVDTNMVPNVVNYYVVRPTARNNEFCQSNEQAVSANRPPVAICKGIVVVSADATCTAVVTPEMVDGGSYDPDGDSITLTVEPSGSLPLGTTNVILTVCDDSGLCTNCQAVVVVEDRTPPTIVCPPSRTVEFADGNGAPVSYVVTASDTCSPVSLVVAPAPGSIFPIGVTQVEATATDAYTNSASCSFSVTVLGAQGVKSNVLAELIALRASTPMDDSFAQKFDYVILHLQNSLNPAYWIDQTHMTPDGGNIAMNEEKLAANMLDVIMSSKQCPVDPAILQGFINRIVRSDRLLAMISIQEAASAGLNPNKIAEDLEQVAKGDEEAEAGRYANAIEHYRNAWRHAIQLRLQVTQNAEGSTQIRFIGINGKSYLMEVSEDLVHWVPLGTNKPDGQGNVTFTDAAAAGQAQRFYRAVEQ